MFRRAMKRPAPLRQSVPQWSGRLFTDIRLQAVSRSFGPGHNIHTLRTQSA